MREAKTGNSRGKNLEHTAQTLGRKKLGMRKEIFLVSGDWVGVREYGFTFQGLNKVPLE